MRKNLVKVASGCFKKRMVMVVCKKLCIVMSGKRRDP
jgi:hypothetical protein